VAFPKDEIKNTLHHLKNRSTGLRSLILLIFRQRRYRRPGRGKTVQVQSEGVVPKFPNLKKARAPAKVEMLSSGRESFPTGKPQKPTQKGKKNTRGGKNSFTVFPQAEKKLVHKVFGLGFLKERFFARKGHHGENGGKSANVVKNRRWGLDGQLTRDVT